MNIILTGAQGSGKGTQARMLVKKYQMKHFSTGDALRAEIASGSELGKQIAALIDNGNMVSAEMVNKLAENIVEEYKDRGIIFDGYPRTLEQAEYLEGLTKIDAVIQITISDEEAIQRVSKRWMCPLCKRNYNLATKPPHHEGHCDIDGTKLTHREDDTEESVKRRLGDYHARTEPLLSHYEGKGIPVHRINGQQDIEKVFTDIVGVVE